MAMEYSARGPIDGRDPLAGAANRMTTIVLFVAGARRLFELAPASCRGAQRRSSGPPVPFLGRPRLEDHFFRRRGIEGPLPPIAVEAVDGASTAEALRADA